MNKYDILYIGLLLTGLGTAGIFFAIFSIKEPKRQPKHRLEKMPKPRYRRTTP